MPKFAVRVTCKGVPEIVTARQVETARELGALLEKAAKDLRGVRKFIPDIGDRKVERVIIRAE